MPNFTGNGVLKATRARAIHDGKIFSFSESILVPSGTLFANGNVLRFFRVDPSKIIPIRVVYDQSGNLDGNGTAGSRTLAGTLGYLRSANRAGTNISFTLNSDGTPTTTPATESSAGLLATGTAPTSATTGMTTFGAAGAAGLLSTGGAGIFPVVTTSGLVDSRGYDANVMDLAVSFTANSTTATTADIVCSLTLEFVNVARGPAGGAFAKPYVYDSRYSLTTQQSS